MLDIQYYQHYKYKVIINKCDLCEDRISCKDDIESHIDVLDEINDSFESVNDKQEPKLLLCDYCTREYKIPSYVTYRALIGAYVDS